MPQTGECLKFRFSVNNQLGVVSNDVVCGPTQTRPDLDILRNEVNPLFGGQLTNLSTQRYRLLESEKNLLVDKFIVRYSRTGVSGSYWKVDTPSDVVNFYLAGVSGFVPASEIRAFVIAHCRMADGTVPDTVFVGAPKFLE